MYTTKGSIHSNSNPHNSAPWRTFKVTQRLRTVTHKKFMRNLKKWLKIKGFKGSVTQLRINPLYI